MGIGRPCEVEAERIGGDMRPSQSARMPAVAEGGCTSCWSHSNVHVVTCLGAIKSAMLIDDLVIFTSSAVYGLHPIASAHQCDELCLFLL